ncbi:hypothetical protein W03_01180 [Nitrosomonas sp. PY1]|uniref:DUF1579 domain-containing protein n=1 Tax=Nitrosomonas sp. PY1 TaxID=1803906 RepID=UPI001FC83535|nr:DUF1579 domain-containing protein [Nitrosomonas sp. PY1]GKS68114.1 hypothetical protein W03_01180 [Nitrosomonas sp. PY1]
MRYMQFTLVIFCALLFTSTVIADDKSAHKPMDMQEMIAAYEKLATPGEPHKLLGSLAGSWTAKTREWIDSQKPPVESTGVSNGKVLLNGRFLQQEYSGTMHGKPYVGIWTVGYDNLLDRYVSTWIATMGTGIFIMDGTASEDGRTITFTGQHAELGGGHMTHRAIWKIIDNSTQEFVMYGTHHGGKEMKIFETIYTRKQ